MGLPRPGELRQKLNYDTVTNIDASSQTTFSSTFISQLIPTYGSFTVKDLNLERVKQVTSRTTSYDAIKDFTTHAGTGIHPCVVVEIVLKWWRVRTDTEHVDMSFITLLITTIQNVSSEWYYNVCDDKRYKGLIKTLDIPKPKAARYIYYRAHIRDVLDNRAYNNNTLEECIRKGDGTPVQLEELYCSNNMERCTSIHMMYQHSHTILLYFLLMEILSITGAF